jgi:hypothetical protein
MAPDEARGLKRLARHERARERVERRLQIAEAGHRAELRELAQELAALHRLERVLILELRDHQVQELLLTERSLVLLRLARAETDAGVVVALADLVDHP